MTSPLFRDQVITGQVMRHWGEGSGLNPVSLALLCWLLVLLAGVGGGILVTGKYPRTVEVGGVLAANQGMIDIRAPAKGIVSEVFAGNGNDVARGDVLLSLQGDVSRVHGKGVVAGQLGENRRQLQLLASRDAGLDVSRGLKRKQAAKERAALEARQRQLGNLLANEQAVLDLQQTRFQRQQYLFNRQWIAADQLEQGRLGVLGQQANLLRTRVELDENRRKLADIDTRLALQESTYEREKAELALRRSTLEARHIELSAGLLQEVVAPVSGSVTLMLVKPGESVSAGQSLGRIESADSSLQADLYIPSRAIGFLAPGQEVKLRLDAFPYQKFGMPSARLVDIAGAVVTVGNDREASGQGAFYKATATLEKQTIVGFGAPIPLRSGMELRARIVLEQRSLLEWLLEPLLINGRLGVQP